MSTRDERREWQAFRERYSFKPSRANFIKHWEEMFGSPPSDEAIDDYMSELNRLKSRVGRKKSKVKITVASVTVQEHVSMGHRLPSYPGICASLHGHNVKVSVTISTVDFLDFKDVSLHLKAYLADFDHALVLHEGDPFVPQLTAWDQRLVLLNVEPTTEAIAQYLFNMMVTHFRVTSVTVFETDKYSATVTTPSATTRTA